MAAKINWHRYETKLRHCRPMYSEGKYNRLCYDRLYSCRLERVVNIDKVCLLTTYYWHFINKHGFNFYPRDTVLARVLAMALCLSVSVCVCLSQVGVLLKRINKSGWFWHGSFLRPILHCIIRKFGYLRKIRVTPSGTLLTTPDFENFATIGRSSKRVTNLAQERWTLRAWSTGLSLVN